MRDTLSLRAPGDGNQLIYQFSYVFSRSNITREGKEQIPYPADFYTKGVHVRRTVDELISDKTFPLTLL